MVALHLQNRLKYKKGTLNMFRNIFIWTILFSIGFGCFIVNDRPSYASTQGIIAVVNDGLISKRDLEKRVKLVMGSSGLPNTDEVRQKLVQQVLQNLISEKLMLQEAVKMGIKVTDKELEGGFAQVAGQNKYKADEFKSLLRRSGIDVSTLYDQIKSQIAWSKLVQKRIRPRVIISERDVDDALARIQSKIGTTEYLTAEIFLPVLDKENEKDVKQLAQKLYSQTKSGKASFFKLAQQFSGSAGAAKGGDIGWVQEAQLQEEILSALQKVKKNQVTNPIKTLDGYHILFLRDTRILTEDTMPSRDQIQYNLGTVRLEKLQSRHLMDVRASAFIEIRG